MHHSSTDSYHPNNFIKIMKNVENMGKLKHGYYSEEVEKMSSNLCRLRKEVKNMPKDKREEKLAEINEIKVEMTQKKEKELTDRTRLIAGGKASYTILLKKIKGNETFIAGDVNALIISQIIKQELRRSYKICPANMNMIIEQMIALLDNPMPKVVIRADIRHFFESIPQKRIVSKLAEDGYLSKRTLKYLKGMLFKCNDIQGNRDEKGMPRGLAFSSYLSELYMKIVDVAIREVDGVYFYKRYVDDIIIIADPSKSSVEEYWRQIAAILNTMGLELHDDSNKKYTVVLDGVTPQAHFDYLGYRFSYTGGRLTVGMAEKRYNKYIRLIDAIFNIYSKCANYRTGKERDVKARSMQRDALHQLFARVRTLTSNGYLSGRKNYVTTGIYYSNKYLTDFGQLTSLDTHLASEIDNMNRYCPQNLFNYGEGNGYKENINNIRHALHKFTFMSGYHERRVYKKGYYSRTLMDLQRIYYSL